MPVKEIEDVDLAEEAFATGREPQVSLPDIDGRRYIIANTRRDAIEKLLLIDSTDLTVWLWRTEDDTGAYNYEWVEFHPQEYEEWLNHSHTVPMVVPTYTYTDVPDFIGAALWSEI